MIVFQHPLSADKTRNIVERWQLARGTRGFDLLLKMAEAWAKLAVDAEKVEELAASEGANPNANT
jgi:hypothetical protein